jgi:hypothetical protein
MIDHDELFKKLLTTFFIEFIELDDVPDVARQFVGLGFGAEQSLNPYPRHYPSICLL